MKQELQLSTDLTGQFWQVSPLKSHNPNGLEDAYTGETAEVHASMSQEGSIFDVMFKPEQEPVYNNINNISSGVITIEKEKNKKDIPG